MTYKKHIKKSLAMFAVFASISMFQLDANAVQVTEYRLPGIDDVYWDPDVPTALKVTDDSGAQDGIPRGTILYRHTHQNIDYYSPVVPETLIGTPADQNSASFRSWGPWNMRANQESNTFPSRYYTTQVRVKQDTKAFTDWGVASNSPNAGTLRAGTIIDVLSITDYANRGYPTRDWIFLETGKYGLNNTQTGVARINASLVDFINPKVDTLHPNWNTNFGGKYYLHNFKSKGKYVNTAMSNHIGLTDARYQNSPYAPDGLANMKGEWRYLGFNAEGDALANPYFPADNLSFTGNAKMYGYTWRTKPWSQQSDISAYNKFTKNGTINFKYDDNPKYAYLKEEAVQKLYNTGDLKTDINSSPSYFAQNKISLRSHPTKQSIVFEGQDAKTIENRTVMIPNELRDLYVKSIVVEEMDSGKQVASYSANSNGNGSIGTGAVKKGQVYKVKVILGNGANSLPIKDSLESLIGFTYNAGSVNTSMPIGSVYDKQTLKIGNKGGLTGNKDSSSTPFEFMLSVNPNQSGHMDLYGYVGPSHVGVDNLNYGNDIGYIRLNIEDNPNPENGCEVVGDTKICGSGDLVPYGIKVFSKTENGKLVYEQRYGESSPLVKEAMIPGYEYRVVYNLIYNGDHIMEYKWIPGVSDNPYTPENEYVPGRWGPGTTKEYEIPMNHYIEKYSGGPRDLDSISKTDKTFYVLPNPNDRYDTTIPMINGVLIGYYADIMMYEHPYLKTRLDIKMPDSRVNKNKNNDSYEIMLKDNFDISISNLKVNPVITYVDDSKKEINYNVTYDANLDVPSYVKSSDYQASIDTAININGKVVYVKDQLVKGGAPNNSKISHLVENVPIPPSGKVTASVNLNYNKQSYETGNYDNNLGSTNVVVEKIKDPALGSPDDTIKPTDNSNNNNPNKGGDANNNCLTPRTRNTWTSTHRKFSWNSKPITYNKIGSGESVTFRKYNTTYENLKEATETYFEDYGITEVLFRSKITKDKNLGNDGWVNLLDSKEKSLGYIKAGYGFELKIVTRYNTDAFTKRTWHISNDGNSGTSVSALNTKPNYGTEDIYLELPGNESTRKILSVSGYEGTVQGLLSSKKEIGSKVEWTYTIKPTDTLGIGEVGKIYIPDNLKDGDYKLSIYTPPVSGVGSVNKNNFSALCDRKEVTIKVQGSSTDDLNSHETQ